VEAGDIIIGLASSGLHTGGHALARKVLLEAAGMKVEDRVAELGRTLGEELLEPSRVYARPVCQVIRSYRRKRVPHAVAHVAGRGLAGALLRVLPQRCAARLSVKSWPVPPVFPMIQRLGGVEEREMFRVFNMGIGMVLIAPPFYAESVRRQLERSGEKAHAIGEVVEGERGVRIE